MKILLQRIEDGLYFEAPGQWTQDYERARDFESGPAALAYSLNSTPKLPPLQIVLKFQNEASDIRIRCNNEVEADSALPAMEKKEARPMAARMTNNHSKASSDSPSGDGDERKSRVA